MSIASYAYADDIYFTPCVLGDPSNVIYFKTFLANLKKKYGEKKKKGVLSFLAGGKKTIASKKPDQVFKAAIASIRTNPWDVSALMAGGQACEELGHSDAAVEYYRAAVEAEPFDVEANKLCCAALRELADFDGALACAHRILKVNPKDHEAAKLRNDITVEKTIHKGKYAKGDSNEVREAAAQMKGIAEDEDVMGRKLSYVEQIERRMKKNPGDMANYLELAQYYYQQSDYGKAEEHYTTVVDLSKKSPDMVERLLDSQKQRLHGDVLKLKEEFEQSRDKTIVPRFNQAKEEYEQKNMELVKHRIKHNPNHAGHRYEYGMLLYKLGSIKEAIAEFQMAKADTIRKGECLLALGECFQKIKQHKLAMTHYQEAVEALAESTEQKENRKIALYRAAKLAYALEDYEKAEKFGLDLAAIDFSYKDLGELLDKVAKKRQN